MRVFELATKLKLPAAEVLQHAAALNLEAKTALAQLTAGEAARIQARVQNKNTEGGDTHVPAAFRKTLDEKRSRAASLTQAKPAEREKLDANLSRAHEAAEKPGEPGKEPAPEPAAPPPVAAEPAPVATPEPLPPPPVKEPEPVAVATPEPPPPPPPPPMAKVEPPPQEKEPKPSKSKAPTLDIFQPAAIKDEPAIKLVKAEEPEDDYEEDDFDDEDDDDFDDEEDDDFSAYVRDKPAAKIDKPRAAERSASDKNAPKKAGIPVPKSVANAPRPVAPAPGRPAASTPARPGQPAAPIRPGQPPAGHPPSGRPGAPATGARPGQQPGKPGQPARPGQPGQKPGLPPKPPQPPKPPKPPARSGFQPVSSSFNKPPAPPPGQPVAGRPGLPPQNNRPGQPPNRPGAPAPQGGRPGQPPRRDDRRPDDRPARRDDRSSRPPVPVSGRPVVPSSPVPAAATPGAPASPDRTIALRGAVIIKDLAELMGMRPNRLIADLMQMNILASINQRIELDHATRIAEKYGFKVELERAKRSNERRPVLPNATKDDEIPDDPPESLVPRPPVVTFLGHVDHGKTSLMDRIRNAKVAAGESGGITQHIGAYTVDVNGKKITFLDTPGHAAFSSMRARGASMTDIAVIIIAADDGVMPQTREAIRHAKNANVQIMVAINKCDLPTAKPDRVRQMLQSEGLTPEEWGGDIVCCQVSAHTGAGVDHLLEMILIQADMMELTANPGRRADGFVIEAQLEQGRGPTATLLVEGGTLKIGDCVLIGENFGKIRGLVDDTGKMVKSVGPSTAARCMGLSGVPEAGSHFRVMLNEKRARELAEQFAQERKATELAASQKATIDNLFSKIKEQQQLQLAVIVKADTQGSAEAICQSLRDIRSNKVSLTIVADAVGNVSQADIQRAAAAGAHIVGFHVACEPGVQSQARHDGVQVNTFRIIYELLDHIRREMLKLIPAEYKEIIRGHAEIRMIFNIGKKGKVAGCQMLDGVLRFADRVRVKRKNEILFDGKFATLQHFQDEVSEVTSAQECGIRFTNNFEAFDAGDIVECYAMEELERTL